MFVQVIVGLRSTEIVCEGGLQIFIKAENVEKYFFLFFFRCDAESLNYLRPCRKIDSRNTNQTKWIIDIQKHSCNFDFSCASRLSAMPKVTK